MGETFAAKPQAKFPFFPFFLAISAAFCTRVRDRSLRRYPLPPATQVIVLTMCVSFLTKAILEDVLSRSL